MFDHRVSSEDTRYLKEFMAIINNIENVSAYTEESITEKIKVFVQKVPQKDKNSINKTFEYVKSISSMTKVKPNIDVNIFESILLYLEFDINTKEYIDNLIHLYKSETERDQIEFAHEILKMKKTNRKMIRKMNEEMNEEMTKKVTNNHYYKISVALCYTFIIQIMYNSSGAKIRYALETILYVVQNIEYGRFCDKTVKDINESNLKKKVDNVVKCVENMKQDMSKIDGKVNGVEQKIIEINENFTKMEQKITKNNENFAKMEQKITKIDEKVNGVEQKIIEINENFTKTNEKIDKFIDYISKKIDGDILNTNKKIDENILDTNIKIDENINRINQDINEMKGKITSTMENYNKELANKISNSIVSSLK